MRTAQDWALDAIDSLRAERDGLRERAIAVEAERDRLRDALERLLAVAPNSLASPLCKCEKCSEFLAAKTAAADALAVRENEK